MLFVTNFSFCRTDNAYLEPRSLEVHQLTAWIPLIDANMVNGCMQVRSGMKVEECEFVEPCFLWMKLLLRSSTIVKQMSKRLWLIDT